MWAARSAYRRQAGSVQRLRHDRVALAQAELSAQLQEEVQKGLLRAYDHLAQMLREMAEALEESTEALRAWSVAGGLPPLPPVALAEHTCAVPHLNARLWNLCRTHLRAQQDREGRQSEERLRSAWRSVNWRRQLESILLGEQSRAPLSSTLHAALRGSVQSAIAEFSAAATQSVREELITRLATECNLEHLLWRDAAAARHPMLGRAESGNKQATTQNLMHRYLESVWSNAKPAANYDVADRLAAHGIPIDFAAVWGSAESDLSETMLREFRLTTLPTEDPFRITFVRTVHGITLADLSTMRRYYTELTLLSEEGVNQVALVERERSSFYGVQRGQQAEIARVRD